MTSTTLAPSRRSRSARSAQSRNSSISSAVVSSGGNGANHTSSPSAAAACAAMLIRPGRDPLTRTAVQPSSRAMIRISAATTAGLKSGLLSCSPGRNPVS